MKITRKTTVIWFITLLLLCGPNARSQQVDPEKIIIAGKFHNPLFSLDSVTLFAWKKIGPISNCFERPTIKQKIALSSDKCFSFEMDANQNLVYFSLSTHTFRNDPIELLSLYKAEAGDSVFIDIRMEKTIRGRILIADNGDKISSSGLKLAFRGNGYEKYECQYRAETAGLLLSANKGTKYSSSFQKLFEQAKLAGSDIEQINRIVKSYKGSLDEKIRQQILVDACAQRLIRYYKQIERMQLFVLSLRPDEMDEFRSFYLIDDDFLFAGLSEGTLGSVVYLADYMVSKNRIRAYYSKEPFEKLLSDQLVTESLKESVWISYLANYFYEITAPNDLINRLLVTTEDPDNHDFLLGLKNSFEREMNLSHFSFLDQRGKKVTIMDFKGYVVFIDFWFSGCAGCVHYYKNIITKLKTEFPSDSRVIFLSVSVDADKDKWSASVQSGAYTDSTSINLYTGTLGTEHPLIKTLRITAYPHVLLLDGNGKVVLNGAQELKSVGLATKAINEVKSNIEVKKQ